MGLRIKKATRQSLYQPGALPRKFFAKAGAKVVESPLLIYSSGRKTMA
jgi:hypothetical protein